MIHGLSNMRPQDLLPGVTPSRLCYGNDADMKNSNVLPLSSMDSASGTQGLFPTKLARSPSRLPLPLKESLGIYGILIIVGGSLGAIGVLGFLLYLWFGHGAASDGAQASQAWRYIAMSDWMTQSVTLSAVVLRVIISVQTTICTSMVAALFLEKHAIRRSSVAWFSVMRSINNGPPKLVELILSSKGPASLKYYELWLMLLMVTVTLVLQFSSTILISDMSEMEIISDANTTTFPSLMMISDDDYIFGVNPFHFLGIPPTYSTFGEVQQQFSVDPSPNGVSNTGLTQRALLPISNADDRTSVRQFDGNSIVLNSQVACVRPDFTAIYGTERYSNRSGDVFGRIEGGVHYNSTFANAEISSESLCSDGNCKDAAFACSIPNSSLDWQSTACIIDGISVQYTKGIYPRWDPSTGPWSENASISLVFSTNLQTPDWKEITRPTSLPEGSPFQEWNSYELLPGRFVNVTLCFSAFNLERYYINMAAPGILREQKANAPLVGLNYSTNDMQSYLGVNTPQQTHETRGILYMEILGEPNDGPPSSPANGIVHNGQLGDLPLGNFTTSLLETYLGSQFGVGAPRNTTMILCLFCYCDSNINIDSSNLALFSDIVGKTGRAANAMLALVSTAWFNIYYTYLDSLSVFQEATVTTTMKVRAPGQCLKEGCPGFISVTVLICIHLVYVAFITILYVRVVRYSRFGNVWHTISQLVTEELSGTFENTNDAEDKDARVGTRKQDSDVLVRLGSLRETARIGIFGVPPPKRSPYLP